MIETLIDLIQREVDELSARLIDALQEKAQVRRQTDYWRQQLKTAQGVESTVPAIADFLNWGAKADHELKMLAEKDFLVEERICECRASLLAMARRRDALVQVLERRQKEADRQARRRLDREMAHRGAALKAAAAAQDLFGH